MYVLQSFHEKDIKNSVHVTAMAYSEIETSAEQGHILELSEVWNRYFELAELAGTEIPHSFVSRRAMFNRSLLDMYDFVVMHNRAVGERQTVLVPMSIRHIPITRLLDEGDCGESTMQLYKASA